MYADGTVKVNRCCSSTAYYTIGMLEIYFRVEKQDIHIPRIRRENGKHISTNINFVVITMVFLISFSVASADLE